MTARDVSKDADLLAIYDFTALVSASARSARQHERIVRAAGAPITGAGLLALRAISRQQPVTASDVAHRLQVDLSTASRHVKSLEDLGFVRRAVDEHDRRVVWLELTPTGRRLLDRARDVALNDFDAALADWTQADRTRLAMLLDRFRYALLQAEVDEAGWSKPRAAARVRG